MTAEERVAALQGRQRARGEDERARAAASNTAASSAEGAVPIPTPVSDPSSHLDEFMRSRDDDLSWDEGGPNRYYNF